MTKEQKFPQDHSWCHNRVIECAQILRDRSMAVWRQETMTRAEVVEVQKIDALLSHLNNAGYPV